MSLGVKGLPVYEEGEEPKTEIKEKYGERDGERRHLGGREIGER